jgi:hypothetical protein
MSKASRILTSRVCTYPILVHAHVFIPLVDLAHHAAIAVVATLQGATHLLLNRGKLSGIHHARWHLLGDA